MGSARLGSDSRTHPAGQRAGFVCFFFNDTATTEIYTLSLHDALPIFTEAALSFLGLGTQPPTPSWGIMLAMGRDRKSTRLNSSHSQISYAVFCLKKKQLPIPPRIRLRSQRPSTTCPPRRPQRRDYRHR